MSRAVSLSARAALYAQQTSVVPLMLLTIDHDDLPAPVRLVSDLQNVVSRGNTYLAYPFEPMLPPAVQGELPRLDMVFHDVQQELIIIARSITTPASVEIEVVMSTALNTVEAGPWSFEVTSIQYSATELRLGLTVESLVTEPYPYRLFNPVDFPLLFKAVAR